MSRTDPLYRICSLDHREKRHDGREYEDQERLLKKVKIFVEAMNKRRLK